MAEKPIPGLTAEQERVFVTYFALKCLPHDLRAEARRLLEALRDWTLLRPTRFGLESTNVFPLERKHYPRIRAVYLAERKPILWSLSAPNYKGTPANAKMEILLKQWSALERAGVLDEVTALWRSIGGFVGDGEETKIHQMKISRDLDARRCAEIVDVLGQIETLMTPVFG